MTISKTSDGIRIFDMTDSSLIGKPSISRQEQLMRLGEARKYKSDMQYSVYFPDGSYYIDEKGWCIFTYNKAEQIAEMLKDRDARVGRV